RQYNFVPHITIAQKLVEDEHSDVFGSLRMKKIALEDTVDRFQLMYQLDNQSWTVYETFVFGKEYVSISSLSKQKKKKNAPCASGVLFLSMNKMFRSTRSLMNMKTKPSIFSAN